MKRAEIGPLPTRRSPLAACLLIAALVTVALPGPGQGAADQPPDLRTLFPHQAPIRAEAVGLVRLPLPGTVLAACKPDLADLRILTADGREVPFVVDRGLGADGAVAEETVALPVVAVDRRETRREEGPPRFWETFSVDASAAPRAGDAELWVLLLETSASDFVRQVTVEAGRDGDEWRPLARQASIFRSLAAGRQRLEVPLAGPPSPRLRITVEGEADGFLEPTFRLRTRRRLAGAPRLELPLQELERRRVGSRTEVDLARPPGVLPELLRIETSTAAFARQVAVWDEGTAGGHRQLAGRQLFRLPAPARADEGGETAEVAQDLELPLPAAMPPQGDRLTLVVTDGDAPPLESLRVAAVVRRPSLLFYLPAAEPAGGPAAGAGSRPTAEAAEADAAASATLLWGGGRAHRPHYGLEELLPEIQRPYEGPRFSAALALARGERIPQAHLGGAFPNPLYDPSPALGFALRPGAPVDPRLYRHLRRARVEAAPEGLARLELLPQDLAVARPDLADLRIVDAQDRQWAYLLEPGRHATDLPLKVEGPDRRERSSRYRLLPPVAPVRARELALTIPQPFFDRAFSLAAVDEEGQTRPLTSGRLVREPDRFQRLALSLGPERSFTALELTVEDGNDAPLPLSAAVLQVPRPQLLFTAVPGEYRLLLGRAEASPPRYELARVRDVVVAVTAAEVETGELTLNPRYSPWATAGQRSRLLSLALWTVLLAAVAFLAFLTLRLARREGGEGGGTGHA